MLGLRRGSVSASDRELDRLDVLWDTFTKLEPKDLILDENVYNELDDRFGEYFEAGMGAEAIQKLIESFDLEAEAEVLREVIRTGKGQKKLRALKRLKVVAAFLQSGNDPAGMVLDCIPVIPPELRLWCNLTVAVLLPPTSMISTVALLTVITA